MRIRPGARTAGEGLALLACAALGFQLLISGRVHLFVGTIITTLLWIACPVLTIMGLWTLARAVRHPNTAGHRRNRIGILIVAPVALGMFVPLQPLSLLGAASYRPAVRGASPSPDQDFSDSWNDGPPKAPKSVSPVAIDPKIGKTVGGYDNGGDNIGVYTPVFFSVEPLAVVAYCIVFLALVAVLVALAKFVATRPPIAEVLERWEHILFPIVLIGLGIVILVSGGAFGL